MVVEYVVNRIKERTIKAHDQQIDVTGEYCDNTDYWNVRVSKIRLQRIM